MFDMTDNAPIRDSKPAPMPPAIWALLFGNLIIGSGVLVVFGSLNDLVSSLQVSTATAGQLITAGAISMCISAPLLATFIGSIDRRKLLTFSLLWYAFFLTISTTMPSFASLLPMRVLTVLSPAIFTAQSAVCAGMLVPVEQRGKAISLAMLGWGGAMVLGVPLSAWISGHYGWEEAFLLVALLSLVSALWLWLKLPKGMKPPALKKSDWVALWKHPVLIRGAVVTVMYSAGQFVLFAYMAPVMRDQAGLSIDQFSLVLVWLGFWGVIGNLVISQFVDRIGAAKMVNISMLMIAAPLACFPLVTNIWLSLVLLVPWGMMFIAVHAAQQTRQINTAPELASATMAISTSGMYIGQGLGAVIGGIILAAGHMLWLGPVGMVILVLGILLSVSLDRRSSNKM
jgi:predicted MFS family arabinose efflux permease